MTLILPDWLITAADQSPLAGWGVRVSGDSIDRVDSHATLRSAFPDDNVIEAPSSVLLPGFVNAHVHLYGTLAHGIPVDDGPTDFWSFLDDYWWPKVEDALDTEMIVAATDYVCAEMLRSGITSFYDILEAPNAIPDALSAQKEVVERRGMRGLLSFEATERAGEHIARKGLEENAALIDSCQPGSLVGGLMCWHTTFTCSDAFITEAFGLAADRSVLSHAHVNEGVHEGVWCQERTGRRTVEHYDHLGIAGPGFLASQCVQLSDREQELLVERDVKMTHMPLANCEVGGGIAPIPELIEAGATVGLGSDGYINDFFAVMRGAFLIHKARLQDPATMPASLVLRMATEDGARALGLERVGRLDPGWAADLQLVDMALPTPLMAHNLIEQLLLWRDHHNVTDVMVAGRWRVRNGEVLNTDLGLLRARTNEQAARLWSHQ
jgi:5-methylthioadenosine/S-adenosylhomocysteine deaminase